MARLRIVSVVEDTWGCSTVYDEDTESNKLEVSNKPSQEISIKSKTSFREVEDYDTYDHRDSEEVQNEIDYFGLTYLQASLFATVLEDTIMKTRIFFECNNELRVCKTEVDMSLLLANKFDIAQPETTDELDGINPRFLGNSDYQLNKLDADRNYFKNVIITVYAEMTLYKTFGSLQRYVKAFIKIENDRIILFEDEAKSKILCKELNKQLRQRRNHIKTVIYDADTTIDALRTKVEDASLNAEIRNRYVENWQRSRTEQHVQTIEDIETQPSSSIEYYKRRIDYEQRVHSEVELLTNISINETLEKVDKWMAKYDKDMEGIDLKIQIKKNDYQNMLDKSIDFENTIEKHDTMMKEWIHFKDEREKARLYREKMNKSAIVVQAWWRGLLVRRQLGPFKVVKKKGGAAAAAGKKK